MRSATPRPPKRPRYTRRPARTPGRRYTPRRPERAGLWCYGVAASGCADALGRSLGAVARPARPGRYIAGGAPWR
jgi:hypothetical protein